MRENLMFFECTLVDTRQNIGQENFYVGKGGRKILYFVECPTSTLDKRKAGHDFLGAAKTTRKSYKTSSRDTRQRVYSIIGSRPSNSDAMAMCPACQVCFSCLLSMLSGVWLSEHSAYSTLLPSVYCLPSVF
jgi:hypothetical protein